MEGEEGGSGMLALGMVARYEVWMSGFLPELMCYRLIRRRGEDRGRRDCFCFRELGWGGLGVQVGLGGWAARALDEVAFGVLASAYRTRWVFRRLLRFRACVFARFFFPFHNGVRHHVRSDHFTHREVSGKSGPGTLRSIHTRCFLLLAQHNSLQCCRLLGSHVDFEKFENLKI